MRIGFITGEYPPLRGGVADYTATLARKLARLGHQVCVLSNQHARQQDNHVPVTIHRGNWDPGAIRTVRNWAKNNQLDIINLQFQTAAYGMSPWIHFLPHFLETPIVTTFHDVRFPYLFPKAGFLRPWIVRHLAKISTGVIVTNQEDLEHLKQATEQIALFPMGTTLDLTPPDDSNITDWIEKANATSNEDDFLLAHFGFLNHSKGIDTLLQALANLTPNYKLVMIGGRTGTADPTNIQYADYIDNLIEELGIANRIQWTGYIGNKEIASYLQSADVVILPFRDGASYRRSSLITAIQQECAIITTQPCYLTPAFTHEKNMILIHPEKPDDLVAAIHKLHDNPALRIKLRREAQILSQQFDWEYIVQGMVAFFEQVSGVQ